MKFIKMVLLLIAIIICNSQGAIIKGTVLSFSDHKPLIGQGLPPRIYIVNTKLFASYDNNGNYIIRDVPLGKQILIYSCFTYVSQCDTIAITDSSQTIIKNVELKEPLIESTPVYEDYHKTLKEESADHPVLKMKLEDYDYSKGIITLYVSMHNNSNLPIYLLQDSLCIHSFSPIIRNQQGDTLENNIVFQDPPSMKFIVDSIDVFKILPGETINFPKIRLELYDFEKYPPGKYTIQLKYDYKVPSRLYGFGFDSNYETKYAESIKIYLLALRGTYYSTNYIKIRND